MIVMTEFHPNVALFASVWTPRVSDFPVRHISIVAHNCDCMIGDIIRTCWIRKNATFVVHEILICINGNISNALFYSLLELPEAWRDVLLEFKTFCYLHSFQFTSAVNSSVRVTWESWKTLLFLEVHCSESWASIASITMCITIDACLFRKLHQGVVFFKVGSFKRCGSCKWPTTSTFSLILDRIHSSFGSPIDSILKWGLSWRLVVTISKLFEFIMAQITSKFCDELLVGHVREKVKTLSVGDALLRVVTSNEIQSLQENSKSISLLLWA